MEYTVDHILGRSFQIGIHGEKLLSVETYKPRRTSEVPGPEPGLPTHWYY
jgi:hypothetical protein